jgi:tetratricopeptide (TPR) repeat protein
MDIESLLHLAEKYYESGNLREAADIYVHILESHPDNADALYTLSIICFRLANYDSAFELMKIAIEADPDRYILHHFLGLLFKRRLQTDKAIECYNRAIQINPDYADAYSNLGAAYKEKGQLDNAASCFQKALKIKPNFADAYSLRTVFSEKGQLDDARSCFREAPVLLRTDLLNYLIKAYDYQNYLEIGVQNPYENFHLIMIENKIGVDPQPRGICDFIMTSDLFFEQYCGNRTFDLIFIDGLHLEQQVTRDFNNAMMHLNQGGIIVLHDCNPQSETLQYEYPVVNAWNGTAWKTFVELRMTRPDLQMHCLDIDEGCGIITVGEQQVYSRTTLDMAKQYFYLEIHRKELLNLITAEQFRKIYCGKDE